MGLDVFLELRNGLIHLAFLDQHADEDQLSSRSAIVTQVNGTLCMLGGFVIHLFHYQSFRVEQLSAPGIWLNLNGSLKVRKGFGRFVRLKIVLPDRKESAQVPRIQFQGLHPVGTRSNGIFRLRRINRKEIFNLGAFRSVALRRFKMFDGVVRLVGSQRLERLSYLSLHLWRERVKSA